MNEIIINRINWLHAVVRQQILWQLNLVGASALPVGGFEFHQRREVDARKVADDNNNVRDQFNGSTASANSSVNSRASRSGQDGSIDWLLCAHRLAHVIT